MFLAKIKKIEEIDETVLIDLEKGIIVFYSEEYTLEGKIPKEIIVLDNYLNTKYVLYNEREEEIYNNTHVYRIKYYYDDDNLNNFNILEYTSSDLVSFMCHYVDLEDNNDLIEIEYQIGDISFKFYGHNVYSQQLNGDYEKYDPAVIVEFYEDVSVDYKMKIVKVIDKFLQLFLFKNTLAHPQIKLAKQDRMNSIVFNHYTDYYVNDDIINIYYQNLLNNDFIKNNIKEVLEFLIDRHDKVDTSYFQMVNSYNSYVFTNIFTKTYASFDRLTNIFYGKTITNNDLEDVKKDLKKLIKEHEKYKENEEIFDKLSNQISNFKNGISHRKKLITAMEDVAKYIPERDSWYNFNTAEIKDNIYDLRNKIIHNGNIISVKREDLLALEKLQWLTFSLQLKEMNVEISDIEDILNCIFGVG